MAQVQISAYCFCLVFFQIKIFQAVVVYIAAGSIIRSDPRSSMQRWESMTDRAGMLTSQRSRRTGVFIGNFEDHLRNLNGLWLVGPQA